MRILRMKQVQERVVLSRSTIYDRINERSPRYDPV
nr:AlpA family phage regulatory protein [Pseudomonas sp. GM_Psu_2]